VCQTKRDRTLEPERNRTDHSNGRHIEIARMTVRRGSNLLRCRRIGGLFKDTKEENERRKKARTTGCEEMGKETLPQKPSPSQVTPV